MKNIFFTSSGVFIGAFTLLCLVSCQSGNLKKDKDLSDSEFNSKDDKGFYGEEFLKKQEEEKRRLAMLEEQKRQENHNQRGDKNQKNSDNSENSNSSNKNTKNSNQSSDAKDEILKNKNSISPELAKKKYPYIVAIEPENSYRDHDGYLVEKDHPDFQKLQTTYQEQKKLPEWDKIQALQKEATVPELKRAIIDKKEFLVHSGTQQIASEYRANASSLRFQTSKFKLEKGERLRSFKSINGPEKDYHLVRSPMPGKHQYYFITDRTSALIRDSKNLKEITIESMKDEMEPELFDKIIETQKNPSKTTGTGYLEIVLFDAAMNKEGKKEVFFNPRFLNLAKINKGNKLGFAMYFNSVTKLLEVIYSVNGEFYLANSPDGESFTDVGPLESLNSRDIERDPSISADGKTLVFASSRGLKSNNLGIVQLFVAKRKSVTEPFSKPYSVPDAINIFGELFPVLFELNNQTFVFFKKYNRSGSNYVEMLYSTEISEAGLVPSVPVDAGQDVPSKYLTISSLELNKLKVWGSFPINGFDVYEMFLSLENKIQIDGEGNLVSN